MNESRRPSGCRGERASATTEAEQRQRIGDRPNARGPLTYVVSRRKIDILDPARETARLEEQLHVGSPSSAGDDGLIANRFQHLTQHRNPVQAIGSERIV